jgi:hypothetical protein
MGKMKPYGEAIKAAGIDTLAIAMATTGKEECV